MRLKRARTVFDGRKQDMSYSDRLLFKLGVDIRLDTFAKLFDRSTRHDAGCDDGRPDERSNINF